ncbi:hypothetical protein EC968_003442 [Mortierella alpina]|nr:hypothetical protein EC968_003442 [Mortierella alpina]
MSLNAPTVSAQDAPTVTLTLLNEAGEAIGQPQAIPYDFCQPITMDVGTSFTTASTSNERSALNLYLDPQCQILAGSTTGKWASSDAGNVTNIRWEGTAPSSAKTGEFLTSRWPPKMAIQTQVAGPGLWVMDPSKGVIVVALVAAVMAIGVLIGVYQVYQAAQFVPPPKKEKKPKGLNVKKIKKKDAYFKKPVRDDQQSFQRLHNESPEPYATRHQPMTERSRDSQYSEAATTFVDWNNNNNNNNTHNSKNQRSNNTGRGGHYNSDSISIDMRDTSHQARSSPSPFQSGSSTLDLINFDQDSSSHRGHNGYNDRGRGGEVLVPMHTFDSNNNYQQHQGRRRASSSRSR